MGKPCLLTLETGKIGQIVAVGICSAVLVSYFINKNVLLQLSFLRKQQWGNGLIVYFSRSF